MVMGYGAVINGGEGSTSKIRLQISFQVRERMEYLEAISLITELINVGIPYVAKQVRLIRGAPEKVQSLEDELQFIVEALGEYDHVFMKDSTVKEWLNQIQKLGQEAKDIIDTFTTQKHIQDYHRKPVTKFFYACCHLAKLRRISIRVNKIKTKMEEIDGYQKKYFPDLFVPTNSEWLEKQRREVEEEDVVGFDVAIQEVRNMLLTKTLKRQVISIMGTTGSGKTTLAKKIYGEINQQFQHHAWVFVPSKYATRDVLLGILGKETSKIDDEKLVEKARSLLQGKRYLVVIDGVEETQLWETLEKDKVFPKEKHQSRLLLTTRSQNVASLASSSTDDQSNIHVMEPLDDDRSWELLEKLVFKDGSFCSQLKNIGKQVASKCAGLPLAIVCLASLLARDICYEHWVNVIADVSWYLNKKDSPPCFGIFGLTYNTIPQYLRKCLLYLGVFPSGFEIPARQVINLWMAEELIEETGRSRAEEIGWRYLHELRKLNLIQVVRKRSDGGVRTFRIHELWTEFCVSKGEREFQVHTKLGSPLSSNVSGRLSIHYSLRYILSNPDYLSNSNLRTLLCFHDKDNLDSNGLTLKFDHFPKLRVFDLGPTRVSKLHKNIKKSSLLKYLRINHPSFYHLPRSIFSLPNLQTFDIKSTCVPSTCLPNDIWRMHNLKHLLLPPHTTLPNCPKQSPKCLPFLQTISAITPNENTAALIMHPRFPSLVKLTLNSQDMEKIQRCLECLDRLDCLQKLKIINPAILPSRPGTLPAQLVKVTLLETDLVADDVMRMLENLDHLQVLKLLKKSIRGPDLEMRPNSFPQLRFLFMEEIGVRTWTICDGAMRSLEELTISRCHELELLPEQIRELPNILQIKVDSRSYCLKQKRQQLSQ